MRDVSNDIREIVWRHIWEQAYNHVRIVDWNYLQDNIEDEVFVWVYEEVLETIKFGV